MKFKFELNSGKILPSGKMPLNIAIVQNGRRVRISTGLSLHPCEFDHAHQRLTESANKMNKTQFIAIYNKVSHIVEIKNSDLYPNLEAARCEITEALRPGSRPKVGNFIDTFEKFIARHSGKTRKGYQTTLNTIERFMGSKFRRLHYEDISFDWLCKFDEFMLESNPSKNSRSVHFRNIRAVFNYAIDENQTALYPFRKFKIKGERTRKRYLSREQILKIFNYQVDEKTAHFQRYIDVFKMSFMLCGINLKDLFKLEKSDYDGERIQYQRAKTGKIYDIKVEPELRALLDKYAGEKKLLNFADTIESHETLTAQTNKCLKAIIPGVTTYWARHSWATAAAYLDIPKETIAAGLGHGGNSVTDIYIAFEQRKVDIANRRVLDYILYNNV